MSGRLRLAVAISGLLLVSALSTACSITYSSRVVNETDEPLFANLLVGRGEDKGKLVPPHARVTLSRDGVATLRVRTLDGATVLLEHQPREDTTTKVTSLDPAPQARPVGRAAGAGYEGSFRQPTSVVCREGEEQSIRAFGMTVTVQSEFDRPLIVSGTEVPIREDDEGEAPEGALLPPLGKASFHISILERAWLTAYEPDGRLVYTQPIPREEFPVLTVPAELPPRSQAVPLLPFTFNSGHGSECASLVDEVWWIVQWPLLVIFLALLLPFLTIWLWLPLALLLGAVATVWIIIRWIMNGAGRRGGARGA